MTHVDTRAISKMMVKKRCDFCLKQKPDNLQASEKILNKDLYSLLVNATKIDATPKQLSSILFCHECAIALMHAEPIVTKARNLLTKLTKPKGKKRNVNGNLSTVELIENNGDESIKEDEKSKNNTTVTKTPKPIVQRRKSTAIPKKFVNTFVGGELNDIAAASSTLIMRDAKVKGNSPISIQQRRNSVTAEAENANKAETVTNADDSFKRNFEKFTDGEDTPAPTINKKQRHESIVSSQDDSDNLKKCLECGKTFLHEDRYLAHVETKKCLKAKFACKEANCSRRFHKLNKLSEHMQRKHPELLNTDEDYD